MLYTTHYFWRRVYRSVIWVHNSAPLCVIHYSLFLEESLEICDLSSLFCSSMYYTLLTIFGGEIRDLWSEFIILLLYVLYTTHYFWRRVQGSVIWVHYSAPLCVIHYSLFLEESLEICDLSSLFCSSMCYTLLTIFGGEIRDLWSEFIILLLYVLYTTHYFWRRV